MHQIPPRYPGKLPEICYYTVGNNNIGQTVLRISDSFGATQVVAMKPAEVTQLIRLLEASITCPDNLKEK